MINSGELLDILDNWGLWTVLCAEYFKDHSAPRRRAEALDDYMKSRRQSLGWMQRGRQHLSYPPLLGRGAIVTLELSLDHVLKPARRKAEILLPASPEPAGRG